MSDGSFTSEVPILYQPTKGHGKVGKFRFPEHHIVGYDGMQAVPSELLEDKETRSGTLLIPKQVASNMRSYIPDLQTYTSQEGLHIGRGEVIRNCAQFVSHAAGIEFNPKMLGDSTEYNNWQLQPVENSYHPDPGEVAVYTRPAGDRWTHWGIGAHLRTKQGIEPMVIGLGGANGHGLVMAASPDIARAQGYSSPHVAVHSSQQMRTAA